MPYSIEIKKDLYSSVHGVSAGYRGHLERKKSETVISQKRKKWDSFQWHVKAKRAVWCHQAISRYNEERHWKSMHFVLTHALSQNKSVECDQNYWKGNIMKVKQISGF